MKTMDIVIENKGFTPILLGIDIVNTPSNAVALLPTKHLLKLINVAIVSGDINTRIGDLMADLEEMIHNHSTAKDKKDQYIKLLREELEELQFINDCKEFQTQQELEKASFKSNSVEV